MNTKVQEALDIIIRKFESGDISAVVKLAGTKRAAGDEGVPMDKWSFFNRLSAYLQSGGSLDCRGFKQWKNVGRSVAGARAVYILAPCFKKYETKDGEEEERLAYFKAIPVFPVESTSGADLPVFDYAPSQPPPLTDVAESLGLSVSYAAQVTNALGSYRVGTGSITLRSKELEVWFHELAHAIHDRLGLIDKANYNHGEVVAEFTAAVLMQLYGYDNTGNAWSYIRGYSSSPMASIKKALSDVEAIMEFLGGIPSPSTPFREQHS